MEKILKSAKQFIDLLLMTFTKVKIEENTYDTNLFTCFNVLILEIIDI